ncbi:MAG TPA: OmpA family protein, partial [Chitinophagaceae bacterium]|nr:OmpA family protein [Chitinophagaceae bacterium]
LTAFFFMSAFAQNDSATAKVNVVVTDMKGKPSKGEQVLFKGASSQKTVSGISDASGRFSLRLPIGDKYVINVKSITDTTRYGMIDIPVLGADEFYSEPFKVNVKFEAARTYTLDNVHFDFGKASLRSESFAELEELVSYLQHKENIKIEIAGHTDNVGKETDNLKLSQQRAETIRNYLIKKGIQPARVLAKGYGASQPIADNDSDEGRQLNRRTEVKIL